MLADRPDFTPCMAPWRGGRAGKAAASVWAPGLHVGGEVLGTRRLFDWVHRNERVMTVPASYSHGPRGRTSRIVRALDPGAPVTVARYLADRIVTEFGVARLKGLNLAQRAEALRAIAHPDFRDQLA